MDLQTTKDFEDWLRKQPEPSPEATASYKSLAAKVKRKVAECKQKQIQHNGSWIHYTKNNWIGHREEMEPDGERPNPGWVGGSQPGHK